MDLTLDDVLKYGKQGLEVAQAGANIFDPANPSTPQTQATSTATNYTPLIIGSVVLVTLLVLIRKK